jgi:hypothetical protein
MAITTIALVTIAAYARSFAGGWISDDVTMIAENPVVHSLSAENLRSILTSRTDPSNFIPLNFLSHAIDWAVWGPRPAGFHFTNLMLHVLNGVLVYAFVRRFERAPGIAAVAGLLWALHPVQVESVAWISERKNVLSTCFFLLAFHAYLSWSTRPRPRTYALFVVLYAAALLSKVNTIVLPALTIAYETMVRRRLRARDVAAVVPLLVCGAVAAWLNLHGNQSHGVAFHGGSFWVTLRTTATVIPGYLFNILVPTRLATFYPVPLHDSWLDPAVAASVAVILGLAALTLGLAWHGRRDAFWLTWFAVTLAPMLNLVPFPALMNDRYLYLPLLGILVPVIRLVAAALHRLKAERAAPALAGAAAAGLALLTVVRVPVFHDELAFWADFALRFSYITADRPYGAPPRLAEKRLLQDALTRHPDRAALHNNIGAFAFEENRIADAIPPLERGRALDPRDPVIALNLGRAYLLAGRLDDAVATLRDAIALEPPSFFAHLNLAVALLHRGDVIGARAELTRAQEIKRDPWFWTAVERQIARAEQQRS